MPRLKIEVPKTSVGMRSGGELNASELGVDERSERANGKRFGQPRHTLEENVSVGEESDEQGLREVGLPHHDARHTSVSDLTKPEFASMLAFNALISLYSDIIVS